VIVVSVGGAWGVEEGRLRHEYGLRGMAPVARRRGQSVKLEMGRGYGVQQDQAVGKCFPWGCYLKMVWLLAEGWGGGIESWAKEAGMGSQCFT